MAKLGTKARPAIVRVKTEQRAAEIMSICNEHGWVCIVGIEPDKREDTSDVDRLLNPTRPEIADQVTGRNEPCPCGSGKKYKHCCGKPKPQVETASPKNQDRSDFQRAVDKALRQFKLREQTEPRIVLKESEPCLVQR